MLCRRHPKEQKEDVPCSRVACYVGGILRSSRKMSLLTLGPELHAMQEVS